MSMIYSLTQASDATIERLLAEPRLITTYIYGPPQPQQPRRGLLTRLFGKRETAPPPPAVESPKFDEDVETCDLDKAWHAIHFLLCGSDWQGEPPAAFLLNWGVEAGEDLSYGPARVFAAVEIAEIDNHLSGVTEADLRSRFDPVRMMELDIYPPIWDRDPAEDDTLGYALAYFAELKEFVARTHARGYGMVGYLS